MTILLRLVPFGKMVQKKTKTFDNQRPWQPSWMMSDTSATILNGDGFRLSSSLIHYLIDKFSIFNASSFRIKHNDTLNLSIYHCTETFQNVEYFVKLLKHGKDNTNKYSKSYLLFDSY